MIYYNGQVLPLCSWPAVHFSSTISTILLNLKINVRRVKWPCTRSCWTAARRPSRQGAILVPNSCLARGNGLQKNGAKKGTRRGGREQKEEEEEWVGYLAVSHHPQVKSETACLDWNVSMVSIYLRNISWVDYSGHARVKGNDRTDRLAGKVILRGGLCIGRSEVLRSLRHYLRPQSQGHHTVDRIEERGVERGSARRSSLKGRERVIVSQTNIGIVLKATLGKLLRDGVGRIQAFPKA